MNSLYQNLELSAVPAITAAVLDWATVMYVLPALGLAQSTTTPVTSGVVVKPTWVQTILGWLVQAVAIFAGIILGNMVNNALFRR
jgi:hypothetical protein